MSAHFEDPVRPSVEVDERPRWVYELTEAVGDLRERADTLGMMANQVFFIVPGPHQELRIAGQPRHLTLRESGEANTYLSLTLNTIEEIEDRRSVVFAEEYIISDKGIAVSAHHQTLESGDKLTAPEQFPVIWETTDNRWAIFRGNQTYWAPNVPHEHFQPQDLEGELAMATNLLHLLAGLTAGCEDAKYPMQ